SRPFSVVTRALRCCTAAITERERLLMSVLCVSSQPSTLSRISFVLTAASTIAASWVEMDSAPPRSAIRSPRQAAAPSRPCFACRPRGYRGSLRPALACIPHAFGILVAGRGTSQRLRTELLRSYWHRPGTTVSQTLVRGGFSAAPLIPNQRVGGRSRLPSLG